MPQFEENKHLSCPGIEIQLEDKDGSPKAPNEVQVIRLGKFSHPFYGGFAISDKTLESFVGNFEKKTLKIDIAADFSHDAGGKAAGWITGLTKKRTGLFAQVEWTKSGREAVESKEFRYTSADFTDDYQDCESLETFGPLLYGFALTNRPFVKGMKPVVKLSDDADVPELSEAKGEIEMAMSTEEKKQLDDLSGKVTQLTEQNAKTAKELADEKAKNERLVAEKALAEQSAQFDKLLADGTVCEAQREAYLANDTIKFAENASKQGENRAPVGTTKETEKKVKLDDLTPEQAEDKVLELAEKLAEKEDCGITDAISIVLNENPKLAEIYEQRTE